MYNSVTLSTELFAIRISQQNIFESAQPWKLRREIICLPHLNRRGWNLCSQKHLTFVTIEFTEILLQICQCVREHLVSTRYQIFLIVFELIWKAGRMIDDDVYVCSVSWENVSWEFNHLIINTVSKTLDSVPPQTM